MNLSSRYTRKIVAFVCFMLLVVVFMVNEFATLQEFEATLVGYSTLQGQPVLVIQKAGEEKTEILSNLPNAVFGKSEGKILEYRNLAIGQQYVFKVNSILFTDLINLLEAKLLR